MATTKHYIFLDEISSNNKLKLKQNESSNHKVLSSNSILNNSNQFNNLFSIDKAQSISSNIKHKLRNDDILTLYDKTSKKLPTSKSIRDKINLVEVIQNTPILFIQDLTPTIQANSGKDYIKLSNTPNLVFTNTDSANIIYGADADNNNIFYIQPIALKKNTDFSYYKLDVSMNLEFDGNYGDGGGTTEYFRIIVENKLNSLKNKNILNYGEYKGWEIHDDSVVSEFLSDSVVLQMDDETDRIYFNISASTDIQQEPGFAIKNLNISFTYLAPSNFSGKPNEF